MKTPKRRHGWPLTPVFALALFFTAPVVAGNGDIHEGVATCASSMCHGSARAKPRSPVLRNEYLTWQHHDAHARAYETLLKPRSRAIAAKLGIGPPQKAPVCLACHADDVPHDKRGKRFQISDGVGCETCHGGSQRWLKYHTGDKATHAGNVKRGLVPLEIASVRAGVCQSCHVGDNKKRFAGHDIMGAGHPRLQFELMTYSVLEPWHYRVDADYHKRKPNADPPAKIWAVGQVSAARLTLAGLRSKRFMASPMWPELSYFDCHACHAPMSADKWRPRDTSRGLPTGTPRLNDSSLVMTLLLEKVIPGGDPDAMLGGIRQLHRASRLGAGPVREAAAALDRQLAGLLERLRTARLTPTLQRRLVKAMADYSSHGNFNDYLTAEQSAMALQVLIKYGDTGIRPDAGLQRDLDRLFNSLNDPDKLNYSLFEHSMKTLGRDL